MKSLLAVLLFGLSSLSAIGAAIQLPGNGLHYAQCQDNDPARSLRLDWKLIFRGNERTFTNFFKLVNPATRISFMSGGFGGSDNFSGDYSFGDGSRKGLLLNASAELTNEKKVRIATRLPYTTSFFHIRKRDLVIEGTLKNERGPLAGLQSPEPNAVGAISPLGTKADDETDAEARLQELNASISSLSESIAAMKASLPTLNDRLKKAEAEFEKKPKPPEGYMNICPDPDVTATGNAVRRNKDELEKAESQLAELEKLRKKVVGQSATDTSSGVQALDNSITITPDIIGQPIVALLKQKAAPRQAAPASETAPDRTKISPDTMAASLREWKALAPGRSTRADVLKIFNVTGGGVGDATMRTYGYRDCPNILVDVTFEISPATQKQFENLSPKDTLHLAWTGGPTDKLLSISKPYLGVLPLD